MQVWIGYLVIVVGLAMIVLGVLAWLGLIKAPIRRDGKSVWDFLIELLRQAGWVVVVGLVLVYMGCKMIGVELPP
jgi:hypothetical protein